jgi:hypothetical protein
MEFSKIPSVAVSGTTQCRCEERTRELARGDADIVVAKVSRSMWRERWIWVPKDQHHVRDDSIFLKFPR